MSIPRPAQDLVLEIIVASLRERGYGPSYSEIGQQIIWSGRGGHSKTNLSFLVAKLEDAGRIIRLSDRMNDVRVPDPESDVPARPAGWQDAVEQIDRGERLENVSVSLPTEVLRQWHTYTLDLERTALMVNAGKADAPVRNRWDGICRRCGKPVERGEGVVVKIGDKWHPHHIEHSGLTEEQLSALPEVGPKAPTEEERLRRRGMA